jgi:hypothetical protein
MKPYVVWLPIPALPSSLILPLPCWLHIAMQAPHCPQAYWAHLLQDLVLVFILLGILCHKYLPT